MLLYLFLPCIILLMDVCISDSNRDSIIGGEFAKSDSINDGDFGNSKSNLLHIDKAACDSDSDREVKNISCHLPRSARVYTY